MGTVYCKLGPHRCEYPSCTTHPVRCHPIVPAADSHYRCWTCVRFDPKECDRQDCPDAAPQGNKAGKAPSDSGASARTSRIQTSVLLPNNPAVAAPLTEAAMEACGKLPNVEMMYGYMVEHAKSLEMELRQSRAPVIGECEECGHKIVTPLRRL